MSQEPLRIDFVSDVACPWCAVGLHSLQAAIVRLGDAVPVQLQFQPFELNPDMPAGGADAAGYLKAKYGLDDAQLARNREHIRQRGAEVGFQFGDRVRVWNTFDAHRLLHWAGLQDAAARAAGDAGANAQWQLKRALLQAYHGEGRDPSAHEVLIDCAAAAGLDAQAAQAVLAGEQYAAEVRAAEAEWQRAGIHSVPSLVINRRHLIQGGQPPAVFEAALRQIAAEG